MTTYIVRVQLTNGTNSQYIALKDRLIAIGFTKNVKDKNGIEYRLPNGNYLINTELSLNKVFKLVQKIALTIDKVPMVLICELVENTITWSGLKKA